MHSLPLDTLQSSQTVRSLAVVTAIVESAIHTRAISIFAADCVPMSNGIALADHQVALGLAEPLFEVTVTVE